MSTMAYDLNRKPSYSKRKRIYVMRAPQVNGNTSLKEDAMAGFNNYKHSEAMPYVRTWVHEDDGPSVLDAQVVKLLCNLEFRASSARWRVAHMLFNARSTPGLCSEHIVHQSPTRQRLHIAPRLGIHPAPSTQGASHAAHSSGISTCQEWAYLVAPKKATPRTAPVAPLARKAIPGCRSMQQARMASKESSRLLTLRPTAP